RRGLAGSVLRREPSCNPSKDLHALHYHFLRRRAPSVVHGDGVRPRDGAGAPDVTEWILLIFGPRGFLEVEPDRPRVPQVPDVAVHALLARPARVDDDRIAAAVRHGHDHTPAAGARPLPLCLRTG